MKRMITGLSLLLVCLFTIPAFAQEAELIKEGDKFWHKRGKGKAGVNMARKAIEQYKMVLAINPEHAGAYWRIARSQYHIGEYSKGKATKKKEYKEGIDYAKLAIHYDKKNPAGYYWMAVCFGKYGVTAGVFQSLALVKHIRKACRKLLSIRRGFEQGGAQRILGRLNYVLNSKIKGLKKTSNKRALKLLRESVKYGPNYLLNRVYLAEALMYAKKKELAKRQLEYVIKMGCGHKSQWRRRFECREDKKKAVKLMKKLKGN